MMNRIRGITWMAIYATITVLLIIASWNITESAGITSFSDRIAILQTVINVVLLIPSLIALAIQIRAAQTTAELDLEIRSIARTPEQARSFWTDQQGDKIQTLQISLVNDGDAIALWYIVRIFIPAGLVNHKDNLYLRTVVGESPQHWKVSPPNEDHPNDFLITFLSNGEFASYPQDGLILVQLSILIKQDRQYAPAYRIKYAIVGEIGNKRKQGTHTFRISA